jgi:hypothetical protein
MSEDDWFEKKKTEILRELKRLPKVRSRIADTPPLWIAALTHWLEARGWRCEAVHKGTCRGRVPCDCAPFEFMDVEKAPVPE